MEELEADYSWNAKMLGEFSIFFLISVTVVTIIMNPGFLGHDIKQRNLLSSFQQYD